MTNTRWKNMYTWQVIVHTPNKCMVYTTLFLCFIIIIFLAEIFLRFISTQLCSLMEKRYTHLVNFVVSDLSYSALDAFYYFSNQR